MNDIPQVVEKNLDCTILSFQNIDRSNYNQVIYPRDSFMRKLTTDVMVVS